MSDRQTSGTAAWPTRLLGELTTKIGSGATPRGGKDVYTREGVAFIRSQNVLDHTLVVDDIARIGDEAANALRNVEVRDGDVLLNITGDSIARCCMVDPGVLPARVNQHVAIIRPTDELNPLFLQKYLTQSSFKSHMLSISSGGTRAALTKAQIERFLIPTPPRSVQDSIAAILGALDDKIAINSRIAVTALGLARANFTSVLNDAETEIVIGELVDLIYGKALRETERRAGVVPVFGCTGQVGWHDVALSPGPCAVVGRKGANAGWVTWSPVPCWVIDTAFYVQVRSPLVTEEFAYFLLEYAELGRLVGDSAVPGLNRNVALAHVVTIPGRDCIQNFTVQAKPLLQTVTMTEKQNRILVELRGRLLSGLMSGAIKVRDAEKLVEDAT